MLCCAERRHSLLSVMSGSSPMAICTLRLRRADHTIIVRTIPSKPMQIPSTTNTHSTGGRPTALQSFSKSASCFRASEVSRSEFFFRRMHSFQCIGCSRHLPY